MAQYDPREESGYTPNRRRAARKRAMAEEPEIDYSDATWDYYLNNTNHTSAQPTVTPKTGNSTPPRENEEKKQDSSKTPTTPPRVNDTGKDTCRPRSHRSKPASSGTDALSSDEDSTPPRSGRAQPKPSGTDEKQPEDTPEAVYSTEHKDDITSFTLKTVLEGLDEIKENLHEVAGELKPIVHDTLDTIHVAHRLLSKYLPPDVNARKFVEVVEANIKQFGGEKNVHVSKLSAILRTFFEYTGLF